MTTSAYHSEGKQKACRRSEHMQVERVPYLPADVRLQSVLWVWQLRKLNLSKGSRADRHDHRRDDASRVHVFAIAAVVGRKVR